MKHKDNHELSQNTDKRNYYVNLIKNKTFYISFKNIVSKKTSKKDS